VSVPLAARGHGGCAASRKQQQKAQTEDYVFFIQLRHAMKLADAEISAERSSVTREFPVTFLCTKPLAVPRTSLQQEPAGNIRALSLEVATTVHVSGNVIEEFLLQSRED
jgi:hypothetical protein